MRSKTSIKRDRFLVTSAAAIGAAAANYSFASAQTEVAATTSGAGKPSIVFCHGLWADGSCFTKVMGPLQAQGYDCIAAQYPLNTPENDVTFAKWAMDVVKAPIVRALVAVARKLAVLLHRLWVNGEVYDPLHSEQRSLQAA